MLADVVLSFYLGASQTAPSDLHVVQSARGNDATMRGVTWRAYPFRFEIYYGIRLTYTPPHGAGNAIVLDFTHAKVYAEAADAVPQDGTWHGAPLDETAPLGSRVQSFEMTHGMNMLGISYAQHIAGGLYAGGGPVVVVPHSETRVDGQPYSSTYEYGGMGFQVLAGVRGCAGTHRVFGEVKYSRLTPHVSIAGGSADTVARTVHELAGIGTAHCER